MNIEQPHPYIVASANSAVVMLLEAQASVAYLARRTITPDSDLRALCQRVFGDEHCEAWPAFDHDTLVSLATAGSSPAVRGLAARVLMQLDVPVTRVPAPMAALMQATWSPTGRLVDVARPPNVQSIAPKTKEAAKIRKASALATLMGSAS